MAAKANRQVMMLIGMLTVDISFQSDNCRENENTRLGKLSSRVCEKLFFLRIVFRPTELKKKVAILYIQYKSINNI